MPRRARPKPLVPSESPSYKEGLNRVTYNYRRGEEFGGLHSSQFVNEGASPSHRDDMHYQEASITHTSFAGRSPQRSDNVTDGAVDNSLSPADTVSSVEITSSSGRNKQRQRTSHRNVTSGTGFELHRGHSVTADSAVPIKSTTKEDGKQLGNEGAVNLKLILKKSSSLSDVDEFFHAFHPSPDRRHSQSNSDESFEIDSKVNARSPSFNYIRRDLQPNEISQQRQQSQHYNLDFQPPPSTQKISSYMASPDHRQQYVPTGKFGLTEIQQSNSALSRPRQPFHQASANTKADSSWPQAPDMTGMHSVGPGSASKSSSIDQIPSSVRRKELRCFLSSPPPKKRRLAVHPSGDGPHNSGMETDLLADQSSAVFRSPIGSSMYSSYGFPDSKKSPLFTKDSDNPGNYYGMSFGLDTPGRSKFDDVLPQASFDATPLPVTDGPAYFKGFTSPSTIDFVSKFNLSKSYSLEENTETNPNTAQAHSTNYDFRRSHQTNNNTSNTFVTQPHSYMRQPEYHHIQPTGYKSHFINPVDSFPPSFVSPTRHSYDRKQSNIASTQRLPNKMKNSPDSTDDFSYPDTSTQRPTSSITSVVPLSTGRSGPQMRESGRFSSPGTFRVKIGSVGGLQQAEARKGMEGINNIIKGGTNSASYLGQPGVFSPMVGGVPPIIGAIHPDLQTPVKILHNSRSAVITGSVVGHHQPGSGASSTSRSMSSVPTIHYPNFPSPSPPIKTSKPFFVKDIDPTPKAEERNRCNCKKCKCLKLYCECFAAELYCEGCNCNDCNNTPEFGTVREKAIADTTAKNPNAFKKKISDVISGTSNSSPRQSHNMGCHCKKTSCLMKYCECFQSDVFCSDKCKCAECKNFHGSQALIDRRRKINDNRGAEKAMRPNDEFWKNNRMMPSKVVGGVIANQNMSMHTHATFPFSSPSPSHTHPAFGHPVMHHMMTPAHSHHYIPRSQPTRMAPMRYSPLGMHPTPPSYVLDDFNRRSIPRAVSNANASWNKMSYSHKTPQLTTPRTPGKRRRFDLHSRKRNIVDVYYNLFGPCNVGIPRSLILGIFSFLSNDDIYNASLVCRQWCKVSLDEELWEF